MNGQDILIEGNLTVPSNIVYCFCFAYRNLDILIRIDYSLCISGNIPEGSMHNNLREGKCANETSLRLQRSSLGKIKLKSREIIFPNKLLIHGSALSATRSLAAYTGRITSM